MRSAVFVTLRFGWKFLALIVCVGIPADIVGPTWASTPSPLFCRDTFLSYAEDAPDRVAQALRLAQQTPDRRRAAIAELSRAEALALADTALAAGLGQVPVDARALPDEALHRVFPSLRYRAASPPPPALLAQFREQAARSLLTAYPDRDGVFVPGVWYDLVEHAAQGSTPGERREMAAVLFERLRRLPPSWQPQTRYDQLVDAALGLRADAVTVSLQRLSEAELRERFGRELVWSQFGNRNLLTPYFEFQNVVDKLNPQPGQLVVDLGSGLGRQGVYVGIARPGVKFIGYEIVDERVAESQRAAQALGLADVRFERQDLSSPDFKPEPADFYYAFNPVSGATFLKMMNDLRQQAVRHGKPFTLVLAFSKDTARLLEPGTGFVEVTPEARFADDDFARFFHFDPKTSWSAFDATAITAQRKIDERLNAAMATANGKAAEAPSEDTSRDVAAVPGRGISLAGPFPLPLLTNGHGEPRLSTVPAVVPVEGAPGAVPRPLRWEDRALVQAAIERGGGGYSHIDFSSLWAWHSADGYKISRRGDAVVLSGRIRGERVFFEPLGVPPAERVKIMRELAAATRPAPKFLYVSPETAALLRGDVQLAVEEDAPTQDYVYATSQLAMLATPKATGAKEPSLGKDLRYKRNKALEFAERAPKPVLHPLEGSETTGDVIAFVEKWARDNAERIGPEGVREVQATLTLLRNRAALGLEGRVLRQDGVVVAFTLGKPVGTDSFVVFAEKALTQGDYAGAYPLLTGLQAKELAERGISRVNRMDDGGAEHLRRAKQALEPTERPPVFSVTVASGAADGR